MSKKTSCGLICSQLALRLKLFTGVFWGVCWGTVATFATRMALQSSFLSAELDLSGTIGQPTRTRTSRMATQRKGSRTPCEASLGVARVFVYTGERSASCSNCSRKNPLVHCRVLGEDLLNTQALIVSKKGRVQPIQAISAFLQEPQGRSFWFLLSLTRALKWRKGD